MASRIYTVRNNTSGKLVRYVRANTLGGAIRAVAEEHFAARPATTDEIFQASKSATFDVLDALAPEVAQNRTDDAAEQSWPKAQAG
jgi:hypothetical protein